MRLIRLCKTALVASVALFFSFVGYGNIADYGSNWQFVQHVLSMDTIFPGSSLRWRAITDPTLQAAAYWLIIGWEIMTALILWVGVAQMLRGLSRPDFAEARTMAILGLSLGLLLYVAGFIAVGGEWFATWQSATWNGQRSAFGFIAMIAAILIIVLMPETERARPT